LKTFGVEAFVKWPNDVFVGRRKIAGILIENQLSGTRVSRSILGIGFNINQSDFGELNATSLYLETGKFVDVKEVLLRFLHHFDRLWSTLIRGEFQVLKSVYSSLLFGLNETLLFEDELGEFQGVITGVDELGRLHVDSSRGGKSYDLKEIRFKL
jgi:BirA family biotin operon repressor/biotin-[acetyl-CoA-carboxylase] ligase